jgi:hypothetical protein
MVECEESQDVLDHITRWRVGGKQNSLPNREGPWSMWGCDETLTEPHHNGYAIAALLQKKPLNLISQPQMPKA